MQSLKNLILVGEEQFLALLKTTIGEEQFNSYKLVILNYAKYSGGFVEVKRKQFAKTIFFSEDNNEPLEWTIKSTHIPVGDGDPVGPGPNNFSDYPENVCIDDKGRLHLKINQREGKWYSTEIISKKSFGYGTYCFYVSSRVDLINENVVLGLYTWDDDPQYNHREIDIEFSRWKNDLNPSNSQYVVQPHDEKGHKHEFNTVLEGDESKHCFTWREDIIYFQSLQDNIDEIIEQWCYPKNKEDNIENCIPVSDKFIPIPGNEKVRINLWLVDGILPSDDKDIEVIIKKFEFIP